MEKFTVVENKRYGASSFCQDLLLRNGDGKLVSGSVFRSYPQITPGTIIKKYRCKGDVSFEVATSYKINGKRYIDIKWKPQTSMAIREFWDWFGFFDGIRFHNDLKQALIQQRIAPTLSRHNNLRLFLGNSIIDTR